MSVCALVFCQSLGFDAREATIDTVHYDLVNGLATCRGVVSSFLSRIEKFNTRVNAIITLNPSALATADELDDQLAVGNATGLLFCIPVLLKDNFDTADMNTTGGSRGLAGSQPTIDAPVVTALRRAGAIVLGKSNLHELALEGLSVSSLGGQTVNPYDFTRTAGGSSGGSGAAMAASFAVIATGTDTVNSLRSPASANSLVSVRPTRGLIGRAGIIPVSYTQDAIGPITRTVKDAAIALTVMVGTDIDPEDHDTDLHTVNRRGIDYSASLEKGSLQGVRLGLLEGFFNRTTSEETTPVNNAMNAMVKKLKNAGVTVVPITSSIYNANTMLNNLDTQRFEFREAIESYLQRPTLIGTQPKSLYQLYNDKSEFLVIPAQYEYVKTALVSSMSNATYKTVKDGIQNLTSAVQQTFALHHLEALIYPQQKNLVVKIGSHSQHGRNGILAALTGSPVVTLPAGFSPKILDAPVGVPIGMEVLGRPWAEEKLLQMAWQIERLTDVRQPPEFAKEIVEASSYEDVPIVKPDRGSISEQYPLGIF